ncbi:hypothetical protein KKR91_05020 [Arthrobacter jiangjiafuii]|uniref:Uncharacterized protein n=1 Tax=Arthrobacter jiangjiafuii TaxID=2817475 RepID=A0A975M6N8_9MICC|nr:hypothetical protein [Arthrobacter jiangjiafuii]MBP3043968.1 hypothetical protein [Arthrobacter jiangjiafuii]QWC10963.1 hypothetical protein KKR91_05020 [Arthrobacter jiangjiafuii]
MGLFDVLSSSRRAAKDTAEAMVTALTAAAPREAQVSAERSGVGLQHLSTTLKVSVVGTRRGMSALVDRLAEPIGQLGKADELELRITESADDAAIFSSLLIGGWRRDREDLDFLVRAHDELVARIPGESVLVDGHYAGFTVSGVARDDAVATAGVLGAVWEDILTDGLGNWPETCIAVEIGGTAEEPEISYAVELGGDGEDDDVGTLPVPLAERQEEARRAIAAWRESLADLDALMKVRPRAGYGVRFGFTPLKFKPRLAVEDWESGDEDEGEADEVVASVKHHHPASKLTVK